jgi:hypothetical protein
VLSKALLSRNGILLDLESKNLLIELVRLHLLVEVRLSSDDEPSDAGLRAEGADP